MLIMTDYDDDGDYNAYNRENAASPDEFTDTELEMRDRGPEYFDWEAWKRGRREQREWEAAYEAREEARRKANPERAKRIDEWEVPF